MKIEITASDDDYNDTESQLILEPTELEGTIWITYKSNKFSVSAKELVKAIEAIT